MSDIHVLDASALLCIVLDEPGAEIAQRSLPTGAISAVNLSEVMAKLSDHGMPLSVAVGMIETFGLRVEPFTLALAVDAAALRSQTRSGGLSLGDRACLATAKQLGATAVTADRAWKKLGPDLGIEMELIR